MTSFKEKEERNCAGYRTERPSYRVGSGKKKLEGLRIDRRGFGETSSENPRGLFTREDGKFFSLFLTTLLKSEVKEGA